MVANLHVPFVVLAGWMFFRERPPRRLVLVLPVLMVGVILVSGLLDHHSVDQHPAAGIAYGITSALAYAGFLLIFRRASSRSRHVAAPLADATAGTAVVSLLLGLLFGNLQLLPPLPSLGWLLVLAVSTQVTGWLLIASSLPKLPAAVSSLLLLIQPIGALFLAALILGQRPNALQLPGALLVCGGLLSVGRHPGVAMPQS